MKILRLSCLCLALIAVNVYSDEVTELDIGSSACWLKERGVAVKEDPISIAGKKTDNGCIAFLRDKEFFERFSFCVYSGFQMVNG